MSRFLSLALVLLIGLLVVDRVRRPEAEPAAPSLPPVTVARSRSETSLPVRSTSPVEESRTPTIDLLARLEGRRRLARAAPYTYFDSLFVETDSTVRRWSETTTLLVVAIPPGDSARTNARLTAVMRRALSTWENAGLGFRFTLAADTDGAQIVVHGTEHLEGNRAGQTDLAWTRDGAIHSALITLARLDRSGGLIPDPVLFAVAVHEVGHALGLPHSPSADDVMYSATHTGVLSARDRATLTLLYELPLGTIREMPSR